MAMRRIREYLDGNHARYIVVTHSPAYTASQVVESTHIPGKSMAKVVVVVAGRQSALAVMPASRDVDTRRLATETRKHDVRLADEAEFAHRFKGCRIGTAPPFGNLFGMQTYLDLELAKSPRIAFNAGTHTDVIVMDFNEYLRLAAPTITDISMPIVEVQYHVV